MILLAAFPLLMIATVAYVAFAADSFHTAKESNNDVWSCCGENKYAPAHADAELQLAA